MTENQLVTRLNKITNPDKLCCFMEMAVEKNNRLLERLAIDRAALLQVWAPIPIPKLEWPTVRMPLKKKKVKKVNTGSKKKSDENIRRILL